jgi:4-diphosphocytidyl-2-C-methyl-D-erythritol kinase
VRLSTEAPAKINRELRVGRLRSDGYHEVYSRMVSIDLADRLTVEPAGELRFSCDDPAVPAGDDNLVVRAARRLARAAGVAPKAAIRLEKRTPTGGGLGGGSADAAAALQLLARLWGCAAEIRESLPAIAAEIGSDVPFFLLGGQADATGRGEIVQPVHDAPARPLLLLVPPFTISTGSVYRAYAGRGRLPERLDVEEPGRRGFLGPNDLTTAVLQVEPRMASYLASAARVSEERAVSGSGSTIVLVAPAAAREELARRHPEARVIVCTTLSRDTYRLRTNPNGGSP